MGTSWSRNPRDISPSSRTTAATLLQTTSVEEHTRVSADHRRRLRCTEPRPVKKPCSSTRLPLHERPIIMLGGLGKNDGHGRNSPRERKCETKTFQMSETQAREDKENRSGPLGELTSASLKGIDTNQEVQSQSHKGEPKDIKEGDKCHQSPGKLRKLLKRRHSTKVSPEVLNEVNSIPSTPSTPKELLPQPVKLPVFDPAAIDTNKNHVGKIMDPKPMAEFHAEEGFVSITQLYNSMAYGQSSPYMFDPTFLLLIDTRSRTEFCSMHIATAHHVDDVNNPELVEPLHTYTLIVLYDENGQSHTLADSMLSRSVQHIHSRGQELFTLQGGYQAFQTAHPYLCSNKMMYTECERPLMIVNYPSIILEDKIFLGRGHHAARLHIIKDLGITHVLNITKEHLNAFPDMLSYMRIQLDDDNSANLLAEFGKTNKFLQDAIDCGGRVLIHCNLGISRSSTVLIAFLMSTRHWRLKDAYHFVKERRPVIHPNKAFWNQLSKYEEQLFGKK